MAGWDEEVGLVDRKMEVGMGGGCNPSAHHCYSDPVSLSSEQPGKVDFVPGNTHTHIHTVRDGSAIVAAGHTSGGTVGQWTRVGKGKMNQVAQYRLMISKGMRGGGKYPSCQCH